MSLLQLTATDLLNLCDAGDNSNVERLLNEISLLPPSQRDSILKKLNDVPSHQFTGAHWACSNDNDRLLFLLSKFGLSVSTPLRQSISHPTLGVIPAGSTPLHVAARVNAIACTQFLLDFPSSNENPNARDHNSHTCLFVAAAFGSAGALQVMASHPKHKFDSYIVTEKSTEQTAECSAWVRGVTVTMAAATTSATALSSLLREFADIKSTDERGHTALHYACQYGQAECTSLLLKAGASLEAKSSKPSLTGAQATPLHTVVRHTPAALTNRLRYLQCIGVLVDAGSDINAQDGRGMTPLHYCSMQRETGAMRLILDVASHKQLKVSLECAMTQKVSVMQGTTSIDIMPGTTAYALAKVRQAYGCAEALLRFKPPHGKQDMFERFVLGHIAKDLIAENEVERLRALVSLAVSEGPSAITDTDLEHPYATHAGPAIGETFDPLVHAHGYVEEVSATVASNAEGGGITIPGTPFSFTPSSHTPICPGTPKLTHTNASWNRRLSNGPIPSSRAEHSVHTGMLSSSVGLIHSGSLDSMGSQPQSLTHTHTHVNTLERSNSGLGIGVTTHAYTHTDTAVKEGGLSAAFKKTQETGSTGFTDAAQPDADKLELQKQIRQLQKKVNEMKGKKKTSTSALESQVSDLTRSLSSAHEELHIFKSRESSREEELILSRSHVNSTLAQHTNKVGQLENTVMSLDERLRKAMTELCVEREKIALRDARLKQQEDVITDLKKKCDYTEDEKLQLERQLEKTVKDLEDCQKKENTEETIEAPLLKSNDKKKAEAPQEGSCCVIC